MTRWQRGFSVNGTMRLHSIESKSIKLVFITVYIVKGRQTIYVHNRKGCNYKSTPQIMGGIHHAPNFTPESPSL